MQSSASGLDELD